jgi:hypothetical protein
MNQNFFTKSSSKTVVPIRANHLKLCALLLLSGCSVFSDSSKTDAPSENGSTVETEEANNRIGQISERRLRQEGFKRGNKALFDDVELIWEIPQKPVEGFVIEYTESGKSDYKRERVKTLDLERFDHPRYGYVYRHVLRGVRSNVPVEIMIRAFNAENTSEPSNPMIVPPRQRRFIQSPFPTQRHLNPARQDVAN